MSYPNIHLLLQAANRRALFVGLSRAALIGMSLLLVGLLLALAVDAVFAFASWGLIVVDLVLLTLCLFLLIRVVGLTWRNRFDARRVARLLEHRLGIADNSLINAIELKASGRSGVSRRLTDEAIARGEVCAREVAVERAIEFRPAIRAAAWTVAVGALIFAAYLIVPTVFGRGLARLLDPTGDHPPFTLVEFDVSVAPETIYHGTPASVTAILGGPDLPDRADIVFVDGGEKQRVPMYSSGPNEYLLTLERVERSRDFYVDTPKGRSPTFRMPVTMVPRVESAEVAYRYPEYTDWSEERHNLTGRDIRAIVGTEVEIEAASNLSLAKGTLELFENNDAGETILEAVSLLPDPQNPTVVRGRFNIRQSAQGRLVLTSANQAVTPDPLETRIIAVPDRKPRIEITEPDAVVVAVENWKIPVVIEAIDDVETARIELSMAINGFGVSPVELPDKIADRRQAQSSYEFDLKTLGARPGDIITYYATAYDNHPDGERFVDTDTYLIQVISNEEFLEYSRRAYRMDQLREELGELQRDLNELKDQREQILEELAEIEEKAARGEGLSPEDQQRIQQLQEQLNDFAEQTRDLAERMRERLEQPQLYDMEESYREMLKSMSHKLDQQANAASELEQAVSRASSSPSPQQEQAVRDASDQFREQNEPFDDGNQQQMEQNRQQAEAFQQADQMQSQAARIRSVIQQQRAIADRLQPLQNASQLSPEQQQRADRLAREQEILRQELDEALSAMEQAAQQANETLPKTSGDAMQLCQGIRQAGIAGDQDQAAQSARSGQAGDAHQAADQAAQKLESFLSQCNGTQSGAATELDEGLSLPKESIQNSLNQLAQGRSLTGLASGRKGQSGRGMNGSMSRFSLHGPSMPETGQSVARTGRMTARQDRGGQQHGAGFSEEAQAAESLSVDARLRSATGAGNLRGVPVGYRDQAEAYFRRLSDESP